MAEGKRESLATSLGFLLVSAGCAVGLGNVWRFPYIVGQNGGALFVCLYILFLVLFGLPMLTAEFAIGRASHLSLIGAYDVLAEKPGIFKKISRLQVAGNWLLMMYYTTVAGWMLAYPVALLSGWFGFAEPEAFFAAFCSNPSAQLFWMAVVCLVGFGVCALGLKRGVEAVTKNMMAILFLILIGLVIYVFTLDGAMQGFSFYLKPSLEPLQTRSLFSIIFDAMGQSFFTLSIGIGSMAIFGSYTSKKYTLGGESAKIIGIDTTVALLSGCVIFPACYAFSTKPDQGQGLLFFTLPKVFEQMGSVGIWVGAAFFIFLGLAALTTVIAVFENILAMSMERRGCSRLHAIKRTAPLLFALSIPCALGFNLLAGFEPLGAGSTILDLEDFLVANIILPIGAFAMLIFCTSSRYWGWHKFLQEANTGRGLRFPKGLRIYMAYILPALLLLTFGISLFIKCHEIYEKMGTTPTAPPPAEESLS